MSSAPALETFPSPRPEREFEIAIKCPEFTSVCPITGQPDFYELTLTYRPKESLIESKSLKLYLSSFRDRGIFAEDLAATLLKDLTSACDPVDFTPSLEWWPSG